jgi:GxxExxY protein
MEMDQLTELIIGECIYIHKALGPGLLESVYEEVLCYRLNRQGIAYRRQAPLPVVFEEVRMDAGFRCDILVDDRLMLELKSVETLHPVHAKTLLTYLKLSDIPVGLLINFNVTMLKDGIKRIVYRY